MKNPSFTQDLYRTQKVPELPRVTPPRWFNGLLVRMPNHLGDAVMAMPALMQLKKALPAECGLFVITPAYLTALYEALPFVDDIVPLSAPHRFWNAAERTKIRQLHAGAALLFNHSLRDVISLRIAGVPRLYGTAARGRSWLLTKSFSFPARIPGDPSGTHQATRYLALAMALGAPAWQGDAPRFLPKVAMEEEKPEITFLCRHPQLLLLAPGAAYGAAKRWPHQNFRSVAEFWIRHGGIVAILGSAAENGIGEAVADGLPVSRCFNLCGKTGFTALIHLFSCAACTVANDSGLMHLGSLLGSRGIVPFGPTDFTDTGPLFPNWTLLHDPVPCAPCLKRVCPKKQRICMETLTAARIIRLLHQIVKEEKIPFQRRSRKFFLSPLDGESTTLCCKLNGQ